MEHPNQFYLESRKLRGGLGTVKQEQITKQEHSEDNVHVGEDNVHVGEDNVHVGAEFGDLSEKDLAELDSMDTM